MAGHYNPDGYLGNLTREDICWGTALQSCRFQFKLETVAISADAIWIIEAINRELWSRRFPKEKRGIHISTKRRSILNAVQIWRQKRSCHCGLVLLLMKKKLHTALTPRTKAKNCEWRWLLPLQFADRGTLSWSTFLLMKTCEMLMSRTIFHTVSLYITLLRQI